MGIIGKYKAGRKEKKHNDRILKETVEQQIWWNAYCKQIAPDRIEEMDTHLLINRRTYVRCVIVGKEKKNGEGYPRDLTSKAIERIQELSFEGCKMMISHGLIQLPDDLAMDNLQRTAFTVNVNQAHAQANNPGGTIDFGLQNKFNDLAANYNQIYLNSQRSFHSSLIIVIKGGELETYEAESNIISILKSERINYTIPYGKMRDVYIAAMPFPVSESISWVDMRSDTAAVLCTTTNLNSRTDDRGLYFGKDIKTNADIVFDLSKLPAKHLTFLGATGAGKTFSFLELLMRAYDMLKTRVIYTTPKADKGTDYRAVAEFYGEDGCIADLGPDGEARINPLQIMYDPQTMGSKASDYARAYDRHKVLFIRFCSVWFGDEFSTNMESYLDETLNEVYETAGIYRDRPETWNRPFPVFNNIRSIWERDLANKDLGTKQRTAEALFNKSYHVGPKGSLNYINSPTNIEFKDFMVVDLSGVPEIIQDAMNVLVTGMLGMRFSTDSKKETIIAVDEAAVYLRNPELSLFMLKTLTQGRSHGVSLWLATQQPGDFAKNNVKEEFKTNMFINIILGANLENAIEYVQDYFNLSEDEMDTLINAEQGEGLLLIRGQRIPIRFEPTELEMKVLKGQYRSENTPTDVEYVNLINESRIIPEYQWLVDEQKVIMANWYEGDASILINQGYEKHRVSRTGEAGTVNAYFPIGAVQNGLINIPGIGKMTVDHYCSVIQLAGIGQEYNADEIQVNHNSEVDLYLRFGKVKVGLEVEEARSHTIDQLIKKKADALGKYDIVKFVCSNLDSKTIVKAVNEDYILRKGASVREFFQTLSLNAQIQENDVNLDVCGENAAL
jgi:hypothetical protein